MRLSASAVANSFAWIMLIALIAVAFVLVVALGPFGLILIGLLTLFVCSAARLNEDTPTWRRAIYSARIEGQIRPEEKAALVAEKQRFLAPLRFFNWCGITLLAAGVAGFVWQQLH
jgi:hypothetical protein